MKKIIALAMLSSSALLTGCASIVGDEQQNIAITSSPSHAHVTITDESAKDIFEGDTPTTVSLEKSTGHYWGKKSYKVVISKAGFTSRTVEITAHANGWYLAGNLVFGGLIGWFVVDPFNGKMYTLSPDHIDATLGENVSRVDGKTSGMHIVLLQDVPSKQRQHLKYIGTAS
ncbi:hypothetical protein LMG33818_000869 [Halomonadaceae bacterium LMG 33818]|uniref:hypothetical protein n=1 Tax=Cernens ardua TaxID=3402176 RepID=UPI003EDC3DF0